jgi:hypothetical protein
MMAAAMQNRNVFSRGLRALGHGLVGAVALGALTTVLLVPGAPVWAGADAGTAAYQAGDYRAALREWKASAKAGSKVAMHNLGMMYDRGQGVRRDPVRAFMWFEVAAQLGGEDEATHRDNLQRSMDESQLDQATRLSRIALTQVLLAAVGYDPGPVDGVLGPRTAAAVGAYQRGAGLRVDGHVTKRLLDSLLATPEARSLGASSEQPGQPRLAH